MKNLNEIIPGLLASILIALFSLILGGLFKNLGAGPIAIILGILLGNSIFVGKSFEKGAKFSENNLLSYSIVLLGGTLNLKTIQSVGFKGILFIVLQMTLTIFFAIIIGKKMHFSKKFQSLMASGNAVCGSSAIGASAPIIDSNENEKSLSITIVNLTGTMLMFLLVPLGKLIFSTKSYEFGALIGGVLQSMGQVVAGGALANEEVQRFAIIFKIVRIIFLVLVLIFLSRRHNNGNKCFYNMIPWYIVGFFILCILFSLGLIPNELSIYLKQMSNKLELIALAGIGMRIKISNLIKSGPSASLYGLLVGLFQTLCAILLISIIF